MFFIHNSVSADSSFNQSDYDLLPLYCQEKVGAKKTDTYKFDHKNWRHAHHFCRGLMFLNRAKIKLIPNIDKAISNIKYVDEAWSQSFVLRPQMHLYLGEAYQMAGNDALAAQNYIKAIHLKPKHPAGYLALSRSYEKMGATDEAISALEDGLKRVPESKSKPLRKNLSRLKK